MCGRFTRYLSWSEIHALYRLTLDWEKFSNAPPAYNVAPTHEVPFVTTNGASNHKLRKGRWWLVPFWCKEMPKQAMFNARIETVETSGAFKHAYASKRCLIPADGFFEWTVSPADGGKHPWHIYLPEHRSFSFAGLWAHNDKLDVTSCTIVTAPAVDPVTKLHDRMPIILDPAAYDAWLDPETTKEGARGLLDRHLAGALRFHRVGREVNNVKTCGNHPGIIEPVNPM